ncbi:YeiH family protein [Sulfurihydrogenibium azorense]|uniref:Putative membrane protein n=1 Tax=Sulfurihydrogenibium azorense (strain DSM 15241 / OCM 825 / Az-Fu1) TaxID=204536 RepID=C1DXA7_SULAA|nr:YeiH family protein [Sulfurihydrogenibium azorense]ACN98540.1 putative membrane protein [Sulfurihydrogenibium azorense Az-Fu1]MDM7274019.1 YeiH family protein [Sulfurihydrogenibium azorense]
MQYLAGFIFSSFLALVAMFISGLDIVKSTVNFSPLIIAIIIGIVIGNTVKIPEVLKPGINFSLKKILRVAIIFLGFRLTFQNIIDVGLEGLLVDAFMLVSTFVLTVFVSQRFFGLDSQMSYMIASGSSICGASAVLATSPIVKGQMHQAAMAVATVTIFGTIAMFLYPLVYKSGLLPGLDDTTYGIYTGATVHEVAQVVAAGFAVSDQAGNTATIAKLTRVIMLAPLLLFLSFYFAKKHATHGVNLREIPIPWFVFGFIAMVGVNSMSIFSKEIVNIINQVDTFLLTVSMAALGIETSLEKMKKAGMKPIYAAFVVFVYLFVVGYIVTLVFHKVLT